MGETRFTSAMDEHRRLVERLHEPARYPHPVAGVRLIETHISSVLLTGSFAYKIKKPVNLGFVDFSSLARRCSCCEEEVRLNRRLAPSVYLGVVTIRGSMDNPRFEGGGEIVECAVKMREFSQSSLLDAMLARGELGCEHVDAVARVMSGFHRCADHASPQSAFGSSGSIALPARQNFAQIRRCLGASARNPVLDALETWTEDRLASLEGTFEGRRREGFVREGHGDLHLGNIAWVDAAAQVFDGIEFDANLRWIDVASDIAFLFMDLTERGRPDLAWRFLDRYLEGSGDYGLPSVLDFYLVYRALVRAKVVCIRSTQEHLSVAERAAALDGFRTYVSFAVRCTQRRQPVLVITHGFSGSGKSALAQAFVQTLGAVRVRSDVERKRLYGLAVDASSGSAIPSGIYTTEATRRTYERLLEQAAFVLQAGFPVIVDAAFLVRQQRDQVRRLAHDMGVPFVIADCRAPEGVLRRRIAARRHDGDASEADIGVLERQLASAQALAADELPQAVVLDAESASPGDVAAVLNDAVRRRAPEAG
jgi:aminoglycoside phosphotransferase family enzyme/gluconate kinase